MKYILYRIAGVSVTLFSFALFAPHSHAATLFLFVKPTTAAVGTEVRVDVKIESADQSFNATQATLTFPADILEVVRVDKTNSLFSFWLQEPTFSNEKGTVTFIGGSATGFTGKSLEALGVVFRVKGAGVANLALSDGAITASDGSGTNILTAMEGIRLSFPTTQGAGPLAEVPTQIIRAPGKAAGLPMKPILSISLYQNSAKWYNVSVPFYAMWDLPADVADVAAVTNGNPNFSPTHSEGLFVSRRFAAPDDGISYVHVRFKNAFGWGPTAHYRINVDTVPPEPFSVSLIAGPSAQFPHRINYNARDALSGVDHFEIAVNNVVSTSTKNDGGYYDLPFHLFPGKNVITVKAFDAAGNSTIGSLDAEVAPIASPTIMRVNKTIYLGEGGLALTGTSLPNTNIALTVKTAGDEMAVYQSDVAADAAGKWSATFDEPLKKGSYFVEAVARNKKGEMSYPVRSEVFSVQERPVLTMWGFDITPTWFWALLTVILLGTFFGGWYSYHLWYVQLGNRTIIAQRDVVIFSRLIEKNLDQLLSNYHFNKLTESDAAEIEFMLHDLKKNVEKMERYIVENIGEIPKQ